jgi:hypothetical protein
LVNDTHLVRVLAWLCGREFGLIQGDGISGFVDRRIRLGDDDRGRQLRDRALIVKERAKFDEWCRRTSARRFTVATIDATGTVPIDMRRRRRRRYDHR